jgi:hypothetical protein
MVENYILVMTYFNQYAHNAMVVENYTLDLKLDALPLLHKV